MVTNNSCCYKCPDKWVSTDIPATTCHGTCLRYKEQVAAQQKINHAKKEDQLLRAIDRETKEINYLKTRKGASRLKLK